MSQPRNGLLSGLLGGTMAPDQIEAESQRLYAIAVKEPSASQWIAELLAADLHAVAAVISRLASTGTTGARLEGLRESARAILEARLADNLVSTTERLEQSATRLAVVALIATIVIGVAGIIVPLLRGE